MNRLQQAINKEISIGGKFFCWHDYTFLSTEIAFNGAHIHLCVNCGKRKGFNQRLIEFTAE